MKKVLLSLLVVLSFVFVSFTLVKADTQTTVELIDGAQIRTDHLNGLKWVANVKNHDNNNVYGFLLAQGEILNLTIENKDALNQVVEGVTAEEPVMSVTMVNFPKSAAATDISVRAYVKVGNTYYYSSNTVVRNLAEVALTAYGNIEGDFVNNIVNYVDENYKSQYVGFDGAVHFGSAKYEVNPANLEKEFVKDWNEKFGTTWTEFNYEAFNTSAKDGTTPLTDDTDKDCSGTNAYAFFNTDPITSAKWGWLLNYFLGETATGVHPKLQINAVISDNGTYTVVNNGKEYTNLYQLKHLSRSLHNFFKAGEEDVNDYPSISFTDSTLFAKICDYNNAIYAFHPTLVRINDEVKLPILEKEGYIFDGYSNDESDVSKFYTVSNTNATLAPQYSAIAYSIKFMNGSNEFTDLAQTYNIEENLFLPTPVLEGYDFIGWYESDDFSGTPVSTIEFGTTGDKVYYAKFETQTYLNVNVQFDANGGKLNPSDVPGDYELEVDKAANYAAEITYLAPNTTTSTLKYQNKIILNYNSALNLFEVVATDAATKTLSDTANGATWTHALANSAANITESISVGQYIYLDTTALASGKQVAHVYNSLDSLTGYATILKKPVTLPVPTNGSEEFAGWRSSVDGSIVKEYPGYMENPGDITYTAVWSAKINANVTFDFNGGNTKYTTREELITDLLADINSAKGSSAYTLEYFKTATTGYNIFTASDTSAKILFSSEEMRTKWGWLILYLKSIRSSSGIDSTSYASVYDEVYNNGYVSSNATFVNIEFVGFINGTNHSYVSGNTTYKSSDYSLTANNNGFWEELSAAENNNYIITSDSLLFNNDNLHRPGYTFNGWYDENGILYDSVSDFLGVSTITLVAKWDKIVVKSNITYQLNGGELEEGYATEYVEGEEFVLPVPTKQDYTFLGWSLTSGSTSYVTSISASTTGDVTVYANWVLSNISAGVTFDYNGGVSEKLIKTNGTAAGSLVVSNYGGDFWSLYASNTFVYISSTNYNPQGAKRIYIAKNDSTGLYKILGVQTSGVSVKPAGTEYIITVSDSYDGTYDDNFDVSKLNTGDYVFFDKSFTGASSTNLVTFTFYKGTVATSTINQTISSSVVFDTPVKEGYKFTGWYDANGNLYDSYTDFAGIDKILVTANYVFDDTLIGSFEDNSWVEKGSSIKLNYEFVSGSNIAVSWKSNTPSIAQVDAEGNVSGNTAGLAEIVVYATDAPTISFTYYVTVVENASTMLKVLLESNNESIYTRNDLPIGAGTPAYYYDTVGSVSQLLFEKYTEYTSFYLSSPSNKSTLTGSGTGGVDFITFHYAADMPYSANYSLRGGYNLASYNKTCNTKGTGASWHYSTGNDGVWYCQNVAYGAWHAGTSKAMKWYSSGVTTSQVGTNIYTTDVTLGSDGYFYIKGVKTSVKNSTGYTRLNDMGLAVKLSGSTWYIGGCYYNSSYKYISSLGGNCNSIGIESSVREGSDLWLTWQYSAQLCAKLLIQFNLPIQRLVGHHFFSGKDCPQPMLEYDLEIWYVFRDMVAQQMAYFKANGATSSSPKAGAAAPTLSTNSAYINSKGRVTSLPTYSTCQTYTLTYTDGGVSKNVTLSTIIPGTVA